MHAYDTLLVYGPENKINQLNKNGDFIVLGEMNAELKKQRFWWMTISCNIYDHTICSFRLYANCQKFNVRCHFNIDFKNHYSTRKLSINKLASHSSNFCFNTVGIAIKNTGTDIWIAGLITSIVESTPIGMAAKSNFGFNLPANCYIN